MPPATVLRAKQMRQACLRRWVLGGQSVWVWKRQQHAFGGLCADLIVQLHTKAAAAELMPSQLSGGMARRVALARAIVMDPELLIYDEPFVGLDPISMGVIVRLIRELNETLGVTSIVVSHDVEELATIAHRSYLLSEGRVVASGTPDELARSEEPVVRQFMSGAADGPVPFHFPAGDLAADILGQSSKGQSPRGRS